MALESLLYLCSLEGRIYPMVGVREGAVSGSGFGLSEVGGVLFDFVHLTSNRVRLFWCHRSLLSFLVRILF